MQRRKFVIGMGSLAASGAAAMGSGAFSAMTVDRSTSINVVNDDEGLIALRPGIDSDVVRQNESGELVIDFGVGNSEGVNVNSIYQLGHFGTYDWMPPEDKLGPPGSAVAGDPYELPGFDIVNQDTVPHGFTCPTSLMKLPATRRCS